MNQKIFLLFLLIFLSAGWPAFGQNPEFQLSTHMRLSGEAATKLSKVFDAAQKTDPTLIEYAQSGSGKDSKGEYISYNQVLNLFGDSETGPTYRLECEFKSYDGGITKILDFCSNSYFSN